MSTSDSLMESLDPVKRITMLQLYHDVFARPASVRAFRFSLGVTLSISLAYSINWPLSFLLPVLVAFMLSLPLPRPSLAAGLRNMRQTVLAFSLGLLFSLFFLQYPLAFLLTLGLMLFHLYYYLNRGGSLWFTLLSFMAILLLSMLANSHEGLAMSVSVGFIITSCLAVIMVWFAHYLVADPVSIRFPPPAEFSRDYSSPAALKALKSTVVIMPLACVFYLFDYSDQLSVLIFSTLFVLKPELNEGKEAGFKSLISTLLGGAYAILFYWLIVAVPEFYFFVILMFLTTLVFGMNIFSGKESAKYYSSALIALIILINGSTAEDASFFDNLLSRVLLISAAVLYITTALKVCDAWLGRSSNKVFAS